MNNSTEIRPNFKDGILRTIIKRNNTNYETNTYHYHRLCFGAENTEKTPQLIAVTQENFVKT
jgi:hypothetical protein